MFEAERRVRLADVSPGGRLRLDAAARFLQDVSSDDTADASLPDAETWVVRKTVIAVAAFPRYLEPLRLATWCSGTGSHWAERRISIVGAAGGSLEAATTWVHVDPATGRPARIPPGFEGVYGEASGGRRVKARLDHLDPPEPLPGGSRGRCGSATSTCSVTSTTRPAGRSWRKRWPERRDLRAPLRAEVQHRTAIERGADVTVATAGEDDLRLWAVAGGAVALTATVSVARLTRPARSGGCRRHRGW